MAQQRITFPVDKAVHAALKAKAKESGISIGRLATLILKKGLEGYEELTYKAKKAAS